MTIRAIVAAAAATADIAAVVASARATQKPTTTAWIHKRSSTIAAVVLVGRCSISSVAPVLLLTMNTIQASLGPRTQVFIAMEAAVARIIIDASVVEGE